MERSWQSLEGTHPIEDAIIIGKAVKTIKPKAINSCWKTVSRYCVWLHRIYNRMIKEIMKDILDNGKKAGVKSFQDRDLREIQRLMKPIQEEGISKRWLGQSASRLVPHMMREKNTEEGSSSARKQTDIRLTRKGDSHHWLLLTSLQHGPFYTGTRTKAQWKKDSYFIETFIEK